MILKGNQRAGGMQLARHLLNAVDNDHVTVHELSGFIADDLAGAFKEAYAVSCGTRCKQFLFSLSLSPPEKESVSVDVFENAIHQIEERMGLSEQPRAIIFHEKDGRRHAHCVWSRINVESMTAINLPHYKLKLRDISRQLYIENKWRMPNGLSNSEERNPLNFTRAEWQQAKRARQDPRAIKELFQDCWAMSDGLKAFRSALEARGYYLAQGDRRGFVAIDWQGEVYAVGRWIGLRGKEVRAKLGDPSHLPSVSDASRTIANQVSLKLKAFDAEIQNEFAQARHGLQTQRKLLVQQQRAERSTLIEKQSGRFVVESQLRNRKFRKNLGAVWDWITGRRAELRKQNETELGQCKARDAQERQSLIDRHLRERRDLQMQMKSVRQRRDVEESMLFVDPLASQETQELGVRKRKRATLDFN